MTYAVSPYVTLGPTLETARLILRPPAVEDFPRWVEFMADEETARFIGGVQPPPQVWRTLCAVAGMWALTGEGMFSILEKSTGLWVGRIGRSARARNPPWPRVRTSYEAGAHHQRRRGEQYCDFPHSCPSCQLRSRSYCCCKRTLAE